MSDPKETAKTAKNEAKAEKKKAKAELKAKKQASVAAQAEAGKLKESAPPGSTSAISAAERSAAAAEAQLQIRRRQMWISFLGVLVATGTLMFSVSRCQVEVAKPVDVKTENS